MREKKNASNTQFILLQINNFRFDNFKLKNSLNKV